MVGKLYSIGYAGKEIDYFIQLLNKNNINCVIDVRSIPFSRQYSNYNSDNIDNVLKQQGIKYFSYKNEFGARRIENNVYCTSKLYDGKIHTYVDFSKVWELEVFINGYMRVINYLNNGLNICFFCSEKYPFDCHRCSMVSEYFYQKGYDIIHIVEENLCYKHSEIIKINLAWEDYKKVKQKIDKECSIKLSMNLFDLIEKKLYSDIERAFLEKWQQFFKMENRENLFKFYNYKVGYRKEEDDYGG